MDAAFARLVSATEQARGILLISADHGNVEQMIDLKTGEPHTAHTTNPVPLIVADFSSKLNGTGKLANGSLEDVAPTLLEIMRIDQPAEMTGKSLILH